eukprot:CAMPEP_0173201558 /NCGR_PEP_ID=MMETSP1141-20130122/18416_1 /TAXON_ID=483371 /ORGANISM="non described non described, Strain CCMP2298" /LENGTH=63 /DNA_ID=CAMNT_0014126689 /DNA_START=246 /DNA_END=437 /DNA_ORIENTATION=-
MATDMLASVTDMCIQARKVRSLAKKTLGSTFMGTLRGLPSGCTAWSARRKSEDHQPLAGDWML